MLRTCLLVALGLAVSGCRDECGRSVNPDFCEGNTLVTCPAVLDQVAPIRWQRGDCGSRTCVQSDAGATCALSPTPSSACDGGTGPVCDGQALLRCEFGFESSRTACPSCDFRVLRSQSCVGSIGSTCSSNADCFTDLRCADAGTASATCREP